MDTLDKIRVSKVLLSKVGTPRSIELVDKLHGFEVLLSSSSSPLSDIVASIPEITAVLTECFEHIPPESKNKFNDHKWGGIVPIVLRLHNFYGCLPHGAGGWSFPPIHSFQVRGLSYLEDSIKSSSDSPLFYLRGVQMIKTESFKYPVIEQSWCPLPRYLDESEWLVVNYMIPGQDNVQIMCYFSASSVAMDAFRNPQSNVAGWSKLMHRFWQANKEYCDEHFKLIPNVVDGPWPVKYSVGSKPALIGKKLTQYYWRKPHVFEIDVDISSSTIASNILKLVRGSSTTVVVDLGITLEGKAEDCLPERILCQARFSKVDFDAALTLSF